MIEPTEVPVSRLTPRQLEVLALVAEGLQDAEIGRRLYISAATAKNHMFNVLTAYKARTRAHAVALAMRAGDIR